MSRARKLFYGFCLGAVAVIYATVSEMDYQDAVQHEQYLMEINSKKMWEEKFPHDMRPTAVSESAFVGKPSKKYFDTEYERIRARYEEKRRARWQAKEVY